jgi:hypothetical protein
MKPLSPSYHGVDWRLGETQNYEIQHRKDVGGAFLWWALALRTVSCASMCGGSNISWMASLIG